MGDRRGSHPAEWLSADDRAGLPCCRASMASCRRGPSIFSSFSSPVWRRPRPCSACWRTAPTCTRRPDRGSAGRGCTKRGADPSRRRARGRGLASLYELAVQRRRSTSTGWRRAVRCLECARGAVRRPGMLWPVARRSARLGRLRRRQPWTAAAGRRALSAGRLSSTLFPTFMALAVVLPRRAVTPLVTVWALAQGLVAALFFTWRPLF